VLLLLHLQLQMHFETIFRLIILFQMRLVCLFLVPCPFVVVPCPFGARAKCAVRSEEGRLSGPTTNVRLDHPPPPACTAGASIHPVWRVATVRRSCCRPSKRTSPELRTARRTLRPAARPLRPDQAERRTACLRRQRDCCLRPTGWSGIPSCGVRVDDPSVSRSLRATARLQPEKERGTMRRIRFTMVVWILVTYAQTSAHAHTLEDLPASQLTGSTFQANATLRLQMSVRHHGAATEEAQESLDTRDEIVATLAIDAERVQVTSWDADTDPGWSRTTILFPPSDAEATPEQLIIQLRDTLTIRPTSLNSTVVLQYVNVTSMRVGDCRIDGCNILDEIVSIQSCMERDCLWLIPVVGFFLVCWATSAGVACYYCRNCKRKSTGVAQVLSDQELTKNAVFTRNEAQMDEAILLKAQQQQGLPPLSPSRRNTLSDLKLREKRLSLPLSRPDSALPVIPRSTSPSTPSISTRPSMSAELTRTPTIEQLRVATIDMTALQPAATVMRAGALSPIAADEYESETDAAERV
jgi:hypothetical protein